MNDEEDLADAVEEELEREDVRDTTANRNRFKSEEPVVKITSDQEQAIEEANEPVAKQAEEAESGHDAREQKVRIVVDRPKAKEKERFDEGFTKEEKEEWKRTRLEEKRATLAERKLRLTQRKRDVEDRKFKEDINVLEQSGTYRKARIVGQTLAPVRAEARASAQARPLSMDEMVGQVRGLKSNPPYNPVIASQGRRADYFGRGHLNAAPRSTHPLTMASPRPNYYAAPRIKPVGGALHSLNKPAHFLRKGTAVKTRWKRAW